MDDYEHECRHRRDGGIEVCIGVRVADDPGITPAPADGSLPADLSGSEVDVLFCDGAELLHRNRPAKALRKLRRAEALAKEKYGDKNPVVAWIQNYVGNALQDMNRLTEAEAAFREALDIRQTTLKACDPSIAVSLNNVGIVICLQGRTDEGAPFLSRAVDIESKAYGPDSRHTMFTRTNLVEVLEGAGHKREAVRELKKLRIGLNRHGDNLFGFGSIPERVEELAKRLGV